MHGMGHWEKLCNQNHNTKHMVHEVYSGLYKKDPQIKWENNETT